MRRLLGHCVSLQIGLAPLEFSLWKNWYAFGCVGLAGMLRRLLGYCVFLQIGLAPLEFCLWQDWCAFGCVGFAGMLRRLLGYCVFLRIGLAPLEFCLWKNWYAFGCVGFAGMLRRLLGFCMFLQIGLAPLEFSLWKNWYAFGCVGFAGMLRRLLGFCVFLQIGLAPLEKTCVKRHNMRVIDAEKQTIAVLLAQGTAKIKKSLPDCTTASLDASLLLAHVLGKSREALILNRGEAICPESVVQYQALVARRCAGEPVAYLTGRKSFWLYDFYVSPEVLIPKPDTELLVEKALQIIEEKLSENTGFPLEIADICTGSGCIAVSLLAHFNKNPEPSRLISVIASDISQAALNVAHKNADTLLNEKARSCLRFRRADLLGFQFETAADSAAHACECLFDLIVSNPPYVPSLVAERLLADGRKEPFLALDGGSDGLDLIRRLVPQSFAALKNGGMLLVETGEYNAADTRELMKVRGFCAVETFNDLAGLPRVTVGKKP